MKTKTEKQTARVVNINKHGQVFEPAGYVVRRSENQEFYKYLEVNYARAENHPRAVGR